MKTAIISGASQGIGACIATRLAKNGYYVVINYCTNENGAKNVLEKCNNQGEIYRANVANSQEVGRMIDDIARRKGSIDVMVCNAGVSKSGLLMDMNDQDIDNMIAINLVGTINCCKYVSKHMLSNNSGTIVTLSSMWGEVGASCEAVYSATKGGIIALTKSLAKELGYSGIRINCIAPGVIDTPMNKNLSQQDIESLIQDTPCCRIGTADDIADAVEWLVSDKASFVNGQTLSINGGFVIK